MSGRVGTGRPGERGGATDEKSTHGGLDSAQLRHAGRVVKEGGGIVGLRGERSALSHGGCALVEDAKPTGEESRRQSQQRKQETDSRRPPPTQATGPHRWALSSVEASCESDATSTVAGC